MKNYYEILEVSPNASQVEIKKQYRFLVQAWHPDKFGSPESKAKAEERLKQINEAYDVLRDSTKREEYDLQRQSSHFQKNSQNNRNEARQREQAESEKRKQEEKNKAQAESERREQETREKERQRKRAEAEQQKQDEVRQPPPSKASSFAPEILGSGGILIGFLCIGAFIVAVLIFSLLQLQAQQTKQESAAATQAVVNSASVSLNNVHSVLCSTKSSVPPYCVEFTVVNNSSFEVYIIRSDSTLTTDSAAYDIDRNPHCQNRQFYILQPGESRFNHCETANDQPLQQVCISVGVPWNLEHLVYDQYRLASDVCATVR